MGNVRSRKLAAICEKTARGGENILMQKEVVGHFTAHLRFFIIIRNPTNGLGSRA